MWKNQFCNFMILSCVLPIADKVKDAVCAFTLTLVTGSCLVLVIELGRLALGSSSVVHTVCI